MENETPRTAQMSPEAVEEARVFEGGVRYFDTEQKQWMDVEGSFVEVGKWTAVGNERKPEDYDCTYFAALLVMHSQDVEWLPTGEDSERRWLVTAGRDENNHVLAFSSKDAELIAGQINTVYRATSKGVRDSRAIA